jgi:putative transposase
MECDCGNVIDRDRNSAVAIIVRFLSQNALWTGYQQFVGNLRKTGLPTPKLEVYSQEALRKRGVVHTFPIPKMRMNS